MWENILIALKKKKKQSNPASMCLKNPPRVLTWKEPGLVEASRERGRWRGVKFSGAGLSDTMQEQVQEGTPRAEMW